MGKANSKKNIIVSMYNMFTFRNRKVPQNPEKHDEFVVNTFVNFCLTARA